MFHRFVSLITGTAIVLGSLSLGVMPVEQALAEGGADVGLTLSAPATVVRGTAIVYTLTANNAGPDVAQNVVVSGTIPSLLSFDASHSDAICTVQSGAVQCAIGSLAVGQSQNISVSLMTVTADPCTGSVQVPMSFSSATTSTDFNAANNLATASTTLQCNAPVVTGCVDVLVSTFDPIGYPMTPVPQFTFSLDGTTQAMNDGSGHVQFANVPVGTHTVTQDTPSAWSLLSVTPTNGSVIVTSAPQCAVVFFRNQQNPIPPNGSSSSSAYQNNVTVNTTVNPSITTTVNPIFNLWLASQLGLQGYPTAQVPSTPVATPGLEISKTDGQSYASPGEVLTYRISVKNNTTLTIPTLRVVDYLPHDILFQSASDDGFMDGGNVRWPSMILMAGESKTFTVTAQLPAYMKEGTVIDNVAQVVGGPSAEDTTIVKMGSCPLTVTTDRSEVEPNALVTYTISYRNDNDQAQVQKITGRFDIRTKFSSATDGGRGRGSVVTWSTLAIPEHSSRSFSTTARVTEYVKDGDIIKFTASTANCSATATVRVRTQNVIGIPLVIQKRADRLEAQPGDIVTYSISVTNGSAKALSNVRLEDVFRADQFTVTSAGGASEVTNNRIVWSIGALAASQTVTVTYQGRVHALLRQGDTVINTATASATNAPSASASYTVYILRIPPQTGVNIDTFALIAWLSIMAMGVTTGGWMMKKRLEEMA